MRDEAGYLTVPGGRIWYRRVGEGSKPVLILHGGPGFCHDYLEPLEALAEDREVVFFDQLGCGLSDRPDDSSLWTVEFFMDEIDSVCDGLGLSGYHLFGQSWGGMLGMNYVIDRKPNILSLTVCNSPGAMSRMTADCDRLLCQLPEDVQETIRWHQEKGFTSCPEYQGAIAYWSGKHICRLRPWPDGLERSFAKLGTDTYGTMIGPSEFYVTGNLADWDIRDGLPEMSVPTLFIAGEHDEITPEHVHELHTLVPDSEYVLFRGVAHMPFYEAPDVFLADLREFLSRTESGLRPAALERVYG